MSLTVVIPWCDRPELARSLEGNRAEFEAARAEILVVDCGGESGGLEELLEEVSLPAVRRIRLPGATFNKALALNVGAYRARGRRLFFLDADVILEPGFFEAASSQVTENRFVTLDRVVESEPGTVIEELPGLAEMAHVFELTDADGRVAALETNRVRFTDDSRSAPGMILLSRDAFLEVGGMNSDLEGWSWEDLDLVARLLFSGFERVCLGSGIHLTHGDDVRALGDLNRPASEARNFRMCLANYRHGHYFGTYDDDVATWGDRLVTSGAGRRASTRRPPEPRR